MSVMEKRVHRTLESLAQAVKNWEEVGDEKKLARWLSRELDGDGVPIRLAVPDWPRCLEVLAGGRRGRGNWPTGCGETIEGLIRATLRFSRPDGRSSLSVGPSDGMPSVWTSTDWRRWYQGTGIARVLDWWSGGRSRGSDPVPPPLPAWSAPDRVLGMLRPDWQPGGDCLAVDHRDVASPCRLELFGGGRTWLAPEWGEGVTATGGPTSRPRPSRSLIGASADLIEWGYRVGGLRVTRSALLLRGRRLAMFSILVEGRGPIGDVEPSLRLTIAPGVAAGAPKRSRALSLAAPGRRGAAQALPIALPCRPYATERGSLRAEGSELILHQMPVDRRCWLPLLVSWDPDRHRKTLTWRVLTVSERSRPVPPDRAFAARVSWGRDETYVIYRSLGPPARRAFLGHQTAARFLVADFDEDGDLKPILAVD
jgi:hypothetical protein